MEMEMELMLVIELLLLYGKAVLCMIGAAILILLVFLGFVFYCICTSEDNCTACPGALDGSCARCRIHKSKLRRARRNEKRHEKLMNKGGTK